MISFSDPVNIYIHSCLARFVSFTVSACFMNRFSIGLGAHAATAALALRKDLSYVESVGSPAYSHPNCTEAIYF